MRRTRIFYSESRVISRQNETLTARLCLSHMNNKSKKPEKLEPQDSRQKEIKHPQNDDEAVVKPSDKSYRQEQADFGDTAKKRENSEQPVKN